MSSRIEVELTSRRDDGTWTWRAAGAKKPKGDLDGSLLYDGAAVGDVVRVDADIMIDGIVVTAVLPPKGARKEPERLEILGPPRRDDQLVTTQLAPKGRGGDRDRRPRRNDRDRDGRPGGDRPGGDRDRRGGRPPSDGPGGERRERRPRPARPERPAPEPKPKAKRLRAGRTHRNAVLAGLPEEQKPVAEQVLKGGIPAVRQAVEKQNEANKAEGKPEISAGPLLTLAEQLMPALRTAEWRDRAEAALADMAELDLRDLRSVVVAADAGARDEESRELAEQLRTGLTERVDAEHTAWLAEIDETLAAGRVVRALRVSSRPPKAGTPFPPELATRLAEEAGKALTADTGSDRFGTVLDALAYSPVRNQVTPEGIPAEPSEELLAAVRKLASRLPSIATLFGIEAPAAPGRSGRGRPRGKARSGGKPVPPPPAAPAPADAGTSEAAPAAPDAAPAAEAPDAAAPDAAATTSEPAALPVDEAPGEAHASAPAEGPRDDDQPASAPAAEEPTVTVHATEPAEGARDDAPTDAEAAPAPEAASEPAPSPEAEPVAESANPGEDTPPAEVATTAEDAPAPDAVTEAAGSAPAEELEATASVVEAADAVDTAPEAPTGDAEA